MCVGGGKSDYDNDNDTKLQQWKYSGGCIADDGNSRMYIHFVYIYRIAAAVVAWTAKTIKRTRAISLYNIGRGRRRWNGVAYAEVGCREGKLCVNRSAGQRMATVTRVHIYIYI